MNREDYKFRGKNMSRFTAGLMVYTYSHETGNMNMRRPGQWSPLAVMDRMPSRPKGALPGVPNDPDYAFATAKNHFNSYRPRRWY